MTAVTTTLSERSGRGGAVDAAAGNGRGAGAPAVPVVANGAPAPEEVQSGAKSAPTPAELRATPERDRALDLAVAGIEKQFGKGAIMRLGDGVGKMVVEAIPTGAIALDLALGIGGFPRGRVVEVYGPESSGQTSLAFHVMAEAQRLGGSAAFNKAEHAFDPLDAKNRCGLKIEDLLVSQPDTGEQGLEICEMLVRSGAVDIVVSESVAALAPRAEIEGDMGESLPGLQARLMSQALRKLTGAISKSRCCVVFINQVREKIGIMFGNPETTPGGRALKFYSSMRLEIRRSDTIKMGSE